MNLVQMSISGAVMIIITVLFRALMVRRLPKKTFLVLWGIVIVRLIVPYSLPCSFSAYTLFAHKENTIGAAGDITSYIPDISAAVSSDMPTGADLQSNVFSINILIVVWLIGAIAFAVFFTISYIKCLRLFRESLPVDNDFTKQWLSEHRLYRQISVRQFDRITSPLTYGIFRPIILLPKNFDKIDSDELKFILTHEYVHIRRFDTVFKLAIIAALCVHWFNPAVWLLYIIANRDIELSCDEDVVRMFGSDEKQAYAMALIHMEERKNGLAPLTNSFGKSAIKERIVSIMKFKKATTLTIAAAAFLIVGTTTVFATTAVEVNPGDTFQQTSDPSGSTDMSNSSDDSSSSTSSNGSQTSDPAGGQETSSPESRDEFEKVWTDEDGNTFYLLTEADKKHSECWVVVWFRYQRNCGFI